MRSIPFCVMFVGGQPVDGFVGALPESQLKQFIDALVKGGKGAARGPSQLDQTLAAERYPDDVPESVKRRRNNELLALQNAISLEDSLPLRGRRVEILVEGPSKVEKKSAAARGGAAARGQLVGRTRDDRIVVFDAAPELAGRIVAVEIEQADAFTLFGRLV